MPWAAQYVQEGVLLGTAEKVWAAFPAAVTATEVSVLEMAMWEMKIRAKAAKAAMTAMMMVFKYLRGMEKNLPISLSLMGLAMMTGVALMET